jgi:S1-C subfamily serine protease
VKIKLPPDEKGFRSTGTGFLVSKEITINDKVIRKTFLVTNNHILGDWNASDGDIIKYNDGFDVYFYRTKTVSGLFYSPLWVGLKNKKGKIKQKVKLHPDPKVDIGIIYLDEELSPSNNIDLASFDVSYLLPFNQIKAWSTGIGDQVFAMGYPLGITSLKSNYPIAKSGYIASMPGEDFVANVPCVNRKGVIVNDTQIKGKLLVIDGLIVGGNSGGPVLLPSEIKSRLDPNTNQVQFTAEPVRNFVIGIVSSNLGPSGVNIAFSSDYILEVIDLFLSENYTK